MFQYARRALIGAAIMAAVGTGALAQDGYDRNVRVINNTGVTITHLYSTNSGRADWGDDLLGSGVIPSGSGVVVDFDDGTGACLFDIRARFADGDVVDRRQINVCQVSSVTFS